MQPFFFISHPAALFTYECWTFYDSYKFIKYFSYIRFLPFAEPFRLFRHFVLFYIKIRPSGFKLLRIRAQSKIYYSLDCACASSKTNFYKDFLSGWN